MFLFLSKVNEYQTEFHLPEDVYEVSCSDQISNLTMISQDGVVEMHLAYQLQVLVVGERERESF